MAVMVVVVGGSTITIIVVGGPGVVILVLGRLLCEMVRS